MSSKEYSDNWDRIFNKNSANLSFSEQKIKDKPKRCETTVGVLYSPEGNKKSVEIGGRKGLNQLDTVIGRSLVVVLIFK